MQLPSESEKVAAYKPLVESLAHKYVDKSGMYSGAEYDDLVQEGLIAVWEALADDRAPGRNTIEWAMARWTRELSRQRGRSVALEAITEDSSATLPIESDYLLDTLDQAAYDAWATVEYGD